MTPSTRAGAPSRLVQLLATYSIPIYAGGLVVIVLFTALTRWAEVGVSTTVRYVVVGGALVAMLVTYAAERRAAADRSEPEYSLYTRASIAMGAFGVAIGGYVALAMDRPLLGVLFIFGAYLFVRMGYKRREREGEEAE